MTVASETICGEKPVYRLYELKNQKLVTFSYNKRQEYSELIKIVYNYALGNATEYELVIGNIMRQMLEAFSTFQYKKDSMIFQLTKAYWPCCQKMFIKPTLKI